MNVIMAKLTIYEHNEETESHHFYGENAMVKATTEAHLLHKSRPNIKISLNVTYKIY
jgi:hypothetical protein